MTDERQPPRIAIDDIAEAAADGVLRALQARDITADFTNRNGFWINITVTAGGPMNGTPGNLMPDATREPAR